MKRFLMLVLVLGLASGSSAAFAAPEISRALVSPSEVEAGQEVIFGAEVTDPAYGGEELRVAVFFRTPDQDIEILPMRYLPEHGVFLATLDIPRAVPNGTYGFRIGAANPDGERAEPAVVELTVFTARDLRVVAPRGSFITDGIMVTDVDEILIPITVIE